MSGEKMDVILVNLRAQKALSNAWVQGSNTTRGAEDEHNPCVAPHPTCFASLFVRLLIQCNNMHYVYDNKISNN